MFNFLLQELGPNTVFNLFLINSNTLVIMIYNLYLDADRQEPCQNADHSNF